MGLRRVVTLAMVPALLVALAACSSEMALVTDGPVDGGTARGPDAPAQLDAPATRDDAGAVDSGADAEIRRDAAAPDAGRDAGELDGGAPAGECDLVTQEPCLPMRACRRVNEPGDVRYAPPRGPPTCVLAGTLLDDMYGTTRRCDDDSADPGYRCRRGSYCQPSGACRRFCDPEGDPCPPTAGGWPRECHAADVGIDPYCWPVGT